MALLFEGHASVVHLNDLSRPVFAFWETVLNDTDNLCELINSVEVTMGEWYKQRAIYDAQDSANLTDLGFAALFLNRTNRSGILSGGVIGGKEQKGKYHLDARFNKKEIIRRITDIGSQRDRIRIYQKDALDFSRQVVQNLSEQSFVFFDPPYIENGNALYLDDYDLNAHTQMAHCVQGLDQLWICTYDHAAVGHGLYASHRRIEYSLPYTAQGRYRGKEVMFLSDRLALPAEWSYANGPVCLTPHKSIYTIYGALLTGDII